MPPQRRAVRRSVLVALAAGLAACASLRGAPTRDLTGQYSYSSTAHGQPVSGTITVTRSQERYQIVMTTGGLTRDLLFSEVTRSANSLTASLEAASGQRMTLHLTVDGKAISGDWALGDQTATLRGTRVGDATGA